MVLAELGMYPASVYTLLRTVNFYYKVLHAERSLAGDILQKIMTEKDQESWTWTREIEHQMSALAINDKWIRQPFVDGLGNYDQQQMKLEIQKLKNKIKSQYIELHYNKELKIDKSTRGFRQMSISTYGISPYLIDGSHKDIRTLILTRFRGLSTLLDKGRLRSTNDQYLTEAQRKCHLCWESLTMNHMLFECEHIRTEATADAKQLWGRTASNMSSEDMMMAILNPQGKQVHEAAVIIQRRLSIFGTDVFGGP